MDAVLSWEVLGIFVVSCWVFCFTDSLVVAWGLSSSAACGILASWLKIKPETPALHSRFLTTGPPGKSPTRESLETTGTWHPLLDFLILLVWDTTWALEFFNSSLSDSDVQESLWTTVLVTENSLVLSSSAFS